MIPPTAAGSARTPGFYVAAALTSMAAIVVLRKQLLNNQDTFFIFIIDLYAQSKKYTKTGVFPYRVNQKSVLIF